MSGRGKHRGVKPEPPKNPCSRGCPRRTTTCHGDGTCPEYLAFYAYSREQEAARLRDARADELLIRGVNKSIALRRIMKGKLH